MKFSLMKKIEPVKRIPNLRDCEAKEFIARSEVLSSLGKTFSYRGYLPIDTPLIEQTDLFLRKSGGELSSRLYSFREPGGMLASLRPEFTTSIMRYILETADSRTFPTRIQYAGPVFRYAPPHATYGQMSRQFTQTGVELVGSNDTSAEGEIISLALEGLHSLGIVSARIEISHIGLIRDLLRQFGISDRVLLFLIDNIGILNHNKQGVNALLKRAEALGLINKPISKKRVYMDSISAEHLIDSIIAPTNANAGVRKRDEIVSRLARKQLESGDIEAFKNALDFLVELSSVSGRADTAIAEGRRCAKDAGLDDYPFTLIEEAVKAAEDEGIEMESMRIMLNLSRGVSYYTGIMFDLLCDSEPDLPLGGGGRYNGLANFLGHTGQLPALGFAYNAESILSVLSPSVKYKSYETFILVWRDHAGKLAALRRANELRRADEIVVLALEDARNIDTLAKEYATSNIEYF